MAQCKTKAELYREYARVIDMCEFTLIKPWECVKYNRQNFHCHPSFCKDPSDYLFALAIVEGKPVFPGDVLYKNSGEKRIIEPGFRFITDYWSWQPPQPKKLVLNGVELPMPSLNYGKVGLVLHFNFDSESCAQEFKEKMFALINSQRV